MAELPEQLRRDLAALRVRAGPPAGAEKRVLASLEGGGFDPDPGPDLDSGPDAPLGEGAGAGAGQGTVAQLVWAGKVVAVTLALTGAGLLAVRGGVLAVRAIAPEPATSVPTADPLDARPPAPIEADDGLVDAPASAPQPERPGAVESPREAPRAASDRRQVERASADTLAVELALLESARAATDPRAALGDLRRHAQQFPRGALATERELLMIERLCELRRFDEARARDRSFAAKHGDSPQHAKLLEVCPELARE